MQIHLLMLTSKLPPLPRLDLLLRGVIRDKTVPSLTMRPFLAPAPGDKRASGFLAAADGLAVFKAMTSETCVGNTETMKMIARLVYEDKVVQR